MSSTLASQKEDWEILFKNPAWLSLVEALQGQTDSLQKRILFDPVEGVGDAMKLERVKGQLEGRLSITATATGMYESVLVDIQSMSEGEENVVP